MKKAQGQWPGKIGQAASNSSWLITASHQLDGSGCSSPILCIFSVVDVQWHLLAAAHRFDIQANLTHAPLAWRFFACQATTAGWEGEQRAETTAGGLSSAGGGNAKKFPFAPIRLCDADMALLGRSTLRLQLWELLRRLKRMARTSAEMEEAQPSRPR